MILSLPVFPLCWRPSLALRRGGLAMAALLLTSCADDETTPPAGTEPIELHLGALVDAAGEAEVVRELDPDGDTTVVVHLDGAARVVEAAVDGGAAPTLSGVGGDPIAGAFASWDGGSWQRPRAFSDETLTLAIPRGATRLTLWARGGPPPSARVERSLAWTEAALLDDPSRVGLGRVLGAAAADGRGGPLLDRWFRRFATTAHSERAAPAQLMDELAAQYGADPAAWPLDALPFKVTGVHNRLDLGPRGGGCGELRVSIASTHPTYAPLHLLFLFRQEPRADDVAPNGEVHCLGSARRWARLSALDGAAFVEAASAVLDEGLIHDRFLLAESVELTVSPWEWRQWKPMADGSLDNPPLFQTLDVPRLNPPGPARDSFLAFVAENADALARRELAFPSALRAQSARVPPSVPAEALSLDGLPAGVLQAHPDLAFQLEIQGCPTCHTHQAKFVQTNVDRTFSDFYKAELEARALRLDAMARGDEVPVPPFGPLQVVTP